ncbi:hypothetical protein BDV12DRAFT_164269 [Aspergillus spectabilis]
MSSNREERLQMRQRGAGTRKIKEVDFGFSLFGQPAEESSQPASQPANAELDGAPAPTLPSFIPPPIIEAADTEPSQPRRAPSSTPANASSQESATQRTPGSARNKRPPRPSTFDIPPDEELVLTRSSKRRRIESPKESSPLISAQPEIQRDASLISIVEEPAVPPIDEGVAIPIRTSTAVIQTNSPSHTSPKEVPPIPTNETNEIPLEGPVDAPEPSGPENATTTAPEPPQGNGTTSSDTTKGSGRGRGKRGRPSSSSPSNASNAELTEPIVTQPTEPPQPAEAIEPPREQESPPQSEFSQTQDNPLRRRTTASVQLLEKFPPADPAPIQEASSEAVPSDTATAKSRRGRKRKNVETTEESAISRQGSNGSAMAEAESEVAPKDINTTREPTGYPRDQPNGMDKGKKRVGRPKKIPSPSPVPMEEPEPDKTKQRDQEPDRQTEPIPEKEQPDAEAVRPSKRKQRKEREPTPRQEDQLATEPAVETSRAAKPRKQRREREPTPREEQPEPEYETEAPRAGRKRNQREEREAPPREEEQPGQEAEAEAPRTGRKRNQREEQEPTSRQPEQEELEPETEQSRPGKKRKQREQQEPTPEQEEQPEPEPESHEQPTGTKRRRGRRPTTRPDELATQETTEERPQATKRNTRQPRGETVPVTVHRLANASSLHGIPIDESASENDADSPDEDLNKQTTKALSRGGVNAADVLAQICRETLEKTLATLKNGIASEANTAKRADWTLRKKAVEAFGSELEGRLFDLSEMLDSNFMLGTKVKKAKRNMMDRRTRLDQVRRQREAIALRMDAVRREHAREEQAGLTRSTISHTLHNLDLALERGSSRAATEDEPLTAGLEFRLRHMAQNVSSTVAGAHGGLLNQIKSFNAQLEATARQLEG